MGWLSRIFSKPDAQSAKAPLNLSWFNTDMHSHFLPGVDDGARTMEESLAMLRKMQDFGYQKCILTPHIKKGTYPNSEADLQLRFLELTQAMDTAGLTIQVELAAEYYLDDHFLNRLENTPLLSFGLQRYVLVEFSFVNAPVFEIETFQRILDKGYTPILAHFERYVYFHGSIASAATYRAMGINIQLNLNSLSGHYGPEVKKQAERMLDEFCVDFVGTDAHRMDHLVLLEAHLDSPYLAQLNERLLKNQGV
ncbi:MAG: tyrosine-protein phosphatase [Flavobacteriales bacterium]